MFSGMAASNPQCDQCSRLYKNSEATSWCFECEESLCTDCVDAHKASKASMNHHTIDLKEVSIIKQNQTLPIQRNCSVHPEFVLDFFCTQHDAPCCRHCMSEVHRSCDKVVPLEIASKGAKTSSFCDDISDGMKQVHSTLQSVIQNRTVNLETIKQEDEQILKKISEFKTSIIEKINELEKSTFSELQRVRQMSILQIETDKATAEKSVKLVEEYLQQIDFLRKNGSDHHMFLLLHEMQSNLQKEDHKLPDLIGNMSVFTLVYKQPANILSELGNLGVVQTRRNPCPISYSPSKHIEAQQLSLSDKTPKSFKLTSKFNVKHAAICSMMVHKDGNLFIASGSSLLEFDKERFVKGYKLSAKLWDITFSKSGKILASIRHQATIHVIGNFKLKERKIDLQRIDRCNGIACANDKIFIGGNRMLYIFDSKFELEKRIPVGDSNLVYLHHDNNKLYFSDCTNVYCMAEDGTEIYTFSSPDLQVPDGITTDGRGNVYVVGRGSDNIHRLSQDGKSSQVILTRSDKIKDPVGLCFSKCHRKLFVANDGGRYVAVYSCE